ncbi:MAG: efflux RND transporter periplasmic adaptor subunit [Melioribacteraceae bacterium]|nr:efflux RND transporter periplasmic adaptor subunit [Melioribacteraceae bacterium]MCF8264594.1 efflux RND transporter periplasmic adaptor subunit [Melioribacteraceae bacterium]
MKLKFKPVYVIPVIILIVGYFLMQLLFTMSEEPEKKTPIPRVKIVQGEVIKLGDVTSEVKAYGRLQATQNIVLTSEVAGIIQQGDVPFLTGQSFKKGDLIVKVDERQTALDLKSAKSDLLTALSNVLPELRIDFEDEYPEWQSFFNSISFDSKISSLPAIKDSKLKLFLARFNIFKLYFTVQNLEIRLEKHFFHAPFNGSITETDLKIGSTARSGTKLGSIIGLSNAELKVPLPSKDLQWINKTQTVKIYSNEMPYVWSGKIKRISENLNQQTQTLEAFIEITAGPTDKLYEGVFLTAELTGTIISDAIKIPRKSLYEESNVYLINKGKLEYVKVNIARAQNSYVIVNSGLNNGDTLAIDVMQGIAPGMAAKAIIDENPLEAN